MKKILNLISLKLTFRVCISLYFLFTFLIAPSVIFFMIKYNKINLHELVEVVRNVHNIGYFIVAGVILGLVPTFTAFKNSSYNILFGYNRWTPIIFLLFFLITFSFCIAGAFVKFEYAIYGLWVFIASNATSWLTFWVIRRGKLNEIKSIPEDEWFMGNSGEKLYKKTL